MRTAFLLLTLSVPAAAQTLEQAGSFNFASMLAAQKAILRASLPAAEARRLVKAKLAGSGVPEAYVDSVFDDPRSRLFPEIPPKFGTPTAPVPPTPYDQYRKYFVTPANLDAGVKFIRDHRALLASIEASYHVDGTLLVGLVCVETRYGTAAGRYPVFDALNTIIQGVPQRSDWAAREAAVFLKMTYAQGQDAHGVLGSYAGAFGFVQFMPTSYERVAVDFDGDGFRRLNEWPDALASAANYLARSGYRAGDPFTPASSIGRSLRSYNHNDNYVQVILDLRDELLKRNP
ncbi:MAG: lytic murein transglycosylase [Elusimicrobia bacterium]|nr:lytic murein transglycosylase [Elusimicrobiota bacterium]